MTKIPQLELKEIETDAGKCAIYEYGTIKGQWSFDDDTIYIMPIVSRGDFVGFLEELESEVGESERFKKITFRRLGFLSELAFFLHKRGYFPNDDAKHVDSLTKVL